jgi:hypothetical protein
MKLQTLALKIGGPVVLISALAIGLTVFLNVGKLDRTLSEVEQSRLHFILADLKDNLETGLDLGLAIGGLDNAQAAIDFETRANPDILAISVIDAQGAIVFHSGAPLKAKFAALAAIKGKEWNGREPDAIISGIKLFNNFDLPAGAVVIRYSPRAHDEFVDIISRKIGLVGLAVVLASSFCLLIGVSVIGGRVGKTLRDMEHGLQGNTAAEVANPQARELAAQVNRSTGAALAEIGATRKALESIEAAS